MLDTAAVEVKGIHHAFGETPVLRGVNLRVEPGEFVTLLGPSGSGKTTLLRILGGLISPDRGQVVIDGQDVTQLPPRSRGIGFVFQNYALFPHMSVWDNVAFPLRVRKVGKETKEAKIKWVLNLVELSDLKDRMPSQLSGGQQQRVALARALVFDPHVVLMDEPLGSLDKRLREQLQDSIRLVQRRVGFTAVYVTHDQGEAFAMSDRIAIMHEGEVLQIGRPDEIYRSPIGPFVADFVGDLNRFEGIISVTHGEVGVSCANGLFIPLPQRLQSKLAGDPMTIGVRPESVELSAQPNESCALPGLIRLTSFQGSHYRVIVDLDSGPAVEAEHRGMSMPAGDGERVWVGWSPEHCVFFPGVA